MRRQTVAGIALLAAAATFVGCGGGGHSAIPGTAPGNNAPAMSSAVFKLSIPLHAAPASTARKPLYISPYTQSISIAVGPQGGSPGTPVIANLTTSDPSCTQVNTTLTCAITAAAPVGSDTFTIALYSGQGATGSVLSSATVNGTVNAGQANSIPLTLNGTVASIALSITNGNNFVPGGYPTTLPVIVTALDASGATIVGPGNYANPIALTNADTSSVTTLSEATVNSPSDVVTLSYNPTDANSGVLNINGLPVGATTISAAATGAEGGAATFQYIADRFSGFGHARTMTGSATVVLTTYNGLGSPSPSPSTWSYTISNTQTVHGNSTFNGVTGLVDANQQFTYTQTAPATAAPAETLTRDIYRGGPLTSPFALYRFFDHEVDINSGTITSPITDYVVGTTTATTNFGIDAWRDDLLPYSATSWLNTNVPFSETWAGSQVATQLVNADSSFTYSQTSPSVGSQTQNANGTASSFNGTTGVTTTINPPSGGFIPVAQQTTSPVAVGVPTSYPAVAVWYPGGSTLPGAFFQNSYVESYGPIDASCNVPAQIATSAWALVQSQTWLRIPIFQYRTRTWTDYFVPGGIGHVCEIYAETLSNYRFSTGVISSRRVTTEVYAVQSTGALAIRRK